MKKKKKKKKKGGKNSKLKTFNYFSFQCILDYHRPHQPPDQMDNLISRKMILTTFPNQVHLLMILVIPPQLYLPLKNKYFKYTLFEIFIFRPKIQLWFPEKIVDFFWLKNSWICCGFGQKFDFSNSVLHSVWKLPRMTHLSFTTT